MAETGATAYVRLTPNDAEKILFATACRIKSVILFQGTYNASNDFELANGKDAVLKFSGTGSGATVTQVLLTLLLTINSKRHGQRDWKRNRQRDGAVTGNVTVTQPVT